MWRQHATFCVVCRNHQVMQCSQHNTVILYYVPASGLERYTTTTNNNNKQIFGVVSFESFHHAPMSHLIFLKDQDRIMRFCCLGWWSLILLVCFILLGLACRVGAMGSIYLLCLMTCRLRRLTVWRLIFLGGGGLFSSYRVCIDFSGSFYFFLICVPFLGS